MDDPSTAGVTEGFGLMFYNARWYDSYLNHFTQPDTIVPDPYNPLDWNRYSYARYNPLRYTDPSGHRACDDQDENGNCIDYELQNKRLHTNLKRFVAPESVEEDEMVTVGVWPFLAQLSPGEYALLLNENGNLNYVLLWQMYQIQQNALNTAGELFPDMNLHNDPADAFRHAYWNALLTREFGAEFARDFTSAHETGYAPYPNREEAFMDLHNNAVGRDIAASSPNASDEQLQQMIMDSLREGDLYVWNGNDIYFSNMCPVCFFP